MVGQLVIGQAMLKICAYVDHLVMVARGEQSICHDSKLSRFAEHSGNMDHHLEHDHADHNWDSLNHFNQCVSACCS